MKTGKSIDITPVIEGIDQILIVDDKDILRFARVDENIKLHCQASSYGHVFANIVDQIVSCSRMQQMQSGTGECGTVRSRAHVKHSIIVQWRYLRPPCVANCD